MASYAEIDPAPLLQQKTQRRLVGKQGFDSNQLFALSTVTTAFVLERYPFPAYIPNLCSPSVHPTKRCQGDDQTDLIQSGSYENSNSSLTLRSSEE